jgi:hypothetical protein
MHIIRGLDGVLISRIDVRQANAIVSALYRSNPANLRVFVDRALDKPSEATEGVPGAVNHPYNALGSMIQATGVISPSFGQMHDQKVALSSLWKLPIDASSCWMQFP